MDNRETEVKFYVANLGAVEAHLQSTGGQLLEPRILEINLRFDTPEAGLQREGRVLRLRRAKQVHLTYKDGSELRDGVLSRREIEFAVSDFELAKEFLEALGYAAVFMYEKCRTTYRVRGGAAGGANGLVPPEATVMLDELPYGNFVEIEGDWATLKPIAQELGLRWERAIPASYHTLFERGARTRSWAFRNLTFENLRTIKVFPEDLGVLVADDLHSLWTTR